MTKSFWVVFPVFSPGDGRIGMEATDLRPVEPADEPQAGAGKGWGVQRSAEALCAPGGPKKG